MGDLDEDLERAASRRDSMESSTSKASGGPAVQKAMSRSLTQQSRLSQGGDGVEEGGRKDKPKANFDEEEEEEDEYARRKREKKEAKKKEESADEHKHEHKHEHHNRRGSAGSTMSMELG